ncbi:S1 family peptidase [Kordiimonas lacus]|uniref:Trypsin n=1 Tax=Kordiimonas lacus TaxID=637679 RepID=A0A1G6UFZ8_9PROT|nr:trypsin-like serine protease [Kordiimonas lacus]SDD40223.1 Trypsin [Kordiimonas lacus]
MRLFFFSCFVILAVISAPARAIIVTKAAPAKQAIVDPKMFAEVVPLLEGRAVGTLVAPQWIVTAAHVAEHAKIGDNILIGHEERSVEQLVFHPSWDAERVGSEGVTDLALIKLEKPVTSVAPARLYREQDETGKRISILGWGRTGDGIDPALVKDGRFRQGFNIIEEADKRLRFRFDAPDSGKAVEFEAVSGPGDSGGPAFITKGQHRFLAGVSSFQQDETYPGIYGVTENYERISNHIEWLLGTINRASPAGN